MQAPRDLAQALVEFDRRLAVDVLAAIYGRLDGPGAENGPSVQQMRSFLANPYPSQRDLDKSTREWKIGFARRERMRGLALEIAKRLGA